MGSSIANTPQSSAELLESLKAQLREAPPKAQLAALYSLVEAQGPGYEILMEFLLEIKAEPAPPIVAARALQLLYRVQSPQVEAFLSENFATGILPLPIDCKVDYSTIQMALVQQKYEVADRLTLEKMCEAAGPIAVKRKWLYFTEVNIFPVIDLQTLDSLWYIYSEGKFGFSQQREIWLGVGKNWEKFWPRIAWKKDNAWTRYPNEFRWDLQAPSGHLPLTNQLRGVRVMDALMNHPAWNQ